MNSSPLPPDPALRVGVVGGGLAGLAAARTLHELGHTAVVFDKGRGPGGRSSSRRGAQFAFDHGAQYFTARDPSFQRLLQGWLADGVAARWEGRIVALDAKGSRPVRGEAGRFVGTPRMSSLAKHLAKGLEVHCGTLVGSLERRAGGWELTRSDGAPLGHFDRLVITLPPTQAAALIGTHSALGARAAAIGMLPCWAVLLGLAESYPVAFDGAFCEGSALSWIARDSSKPDRPPVEAWVLHAAPEWTVAHLDERPECVVDQLSTELELLAGRDLPGVLHREAHLWRFAQPEAQLDGQTLFDRERGLVLAGDAYNGGRIEGAFQSGLAAARQLTEVHG